MAGAITFRFVLCRVRCRWPLLRHGLPVAGFLPELGHPQRWPFFSQPVRGAFALGPAHHWACVMFLSVVLSGLRRWLHARETARQLNALSDCELSDIGIARHDITRVARQAQ